MLTWAIMVKLILVTIKALETWVTMVTMVTSKRSKSRDIGKLGNEAHRDISETSVTITLTVRSSCKLCAVFFPILAETGKSSQFLSSSPRCISEHFMFLYRAL